MKKFDLNKYEANKKLPLITNEGKRVDILTTSFFKNGKTYCLGVTDDDQYNDVILIFDRDGNCVDNPKLKVGFKTIEKSGWVILEDLPDGNQLVRRGCIYKTQLEALLDCKISNAKVVEINWEE